MNSKLLIFIFVLIGFKSIDSSIVTYELIDGENIVKIDGLNIGDRKDPFYEVKELTFNISEYVKVGQKLYNQIVCTNTTPKYNLCKLGNGKYQARFVKCVNINYGTEKRAEFRCVHSGQRVTNKNIMSRGYGISCLKFTKDDVERKCQYSYSLVTLPGFTENDDVEQ